MRFKKHKPADEQRRRPISTTAPGVFSYYSQRERSTQTNPTVRSRQQEPISVVKRTRLRIGYVPSYIALCAIVIAVLYSFWLQPVPRLHIQSHTGTVYREHEAYQHGIEEIWQSSIFNQTKLTVRDQQIKREILEHFGELADVRIELPLLGRRPAVTLVPAEPALKLTSSNGTFYVSGTGRVMAKTTDVTENEVATLPLIRDETGIDAEPGKLAIPEAQATFLAQLYAYLTEAGAQIQSITLPSTAANQADVRFADVTYYVKFALGTDPRQAVGSYLAVRDKLTADGTSPVEYIDVRVEEKVFYR